MALAEPFPIELAVGVRGASGVEWLSPGRFAKVPETLGAELSFLSKRDCYLYAILSVSQDPLAQMVWPPLSTAEIIKAKAGEQIRVSIPGKAGTPGDKSKLSILVFDSPPLKLHASLNKGRPEVAKLDRVIRGLLQESSPFASNSSQPLALLAGTVRTTGAELKGLSFVVDSFWAGIYEWQGPVSP